MLKRLSRIIIMLVLILGIGGILTASVGGSRAYAEEGNGETSSEQSENNDGGGGGSGGGSSSSVDPLGDACKHNKDAVICQGKQKPLEQTVTDIVKIVVGLLGAIAVIMIIWAGWTYVTSAGASDKVMLAKRTILYAVIGLVVTIMAGAIVAIVVNTFK